MDKYSRRILIFIVTLVILFTVSLFSAHLLIKSESFKKALISKLKEETGADYSYKDMGFSILPRFKITIKNVSYSLETDKRHYSGNLPSLGVYPVISELFRKRLEISELSLESPKLNYGIDLKSLKKGILGENLPIINFVRNYFSELAELSKGFKGIKIKLDNGLLNLIVDDYGNLSFRNINLEIDSRDKILNVVVESNSDLFKHLYSSLNIDTKEMKAKMIVKLQDAVPHLLNKYHIYSSKYRLKDSLMDLNIELFRFDLRKNGYKHLKGRVTGNLDRLTVTSLNGATSLRGEKIDGYFNLGENISKYYFREIKLSKPSISLNGEIDISNNPHSVSLLIGGKNFNVKPVHETAKTIFSETGLSGKIFNVVRGGEVKWIQVRSKAAYFRDLFKKGNYDVRGKMDKGEIYVPTLGWTCNDVYGDVKISNNILEGKNLGGRHNGVIGSDGSLTLGLTKDREVLKLDAAFKGKLEAAPYYINKFVSNEILLKEISKVSDIKGTAEGRFNLGDTKSSPNFKIDASILNLSAIYLRIPYVINITGGSFLYNNSRIEIRDLDANVSNSDFSGISLNYDWTGDKYLDIPKLKAKLSLAEFYPWINSFDELKKYLKKLKLFKGDIGISDFQFKGDPEKPMLWQFQVDGTGSVNDNELINFAYDVQRANQDINIRKLDIKDNYSDLKLNLDYEKSIKQLNVQGNLSGNTLNNIIKHRDKFDGYINGDLKLNMNGGEIITQGELEGQYILCGIYIKAKVRGEDGLTKLDMHINNENNELGDTIECFTDKQTPITGKYEFNVDINSNEKADNLKKLMQGTYAFKSKDGTIMREENLFFKIFSILNVSTLFKGKLGTINDKNLTYEEINSLGNIEDGKFIIKNGELYGPSTGLLANGYIDPIDKHMDIHLKATPLESIDWFLRIIPLLDKLQTKKFIYIPIHIVGWFDNHNFDFINNQQQSN